MVRHTRALIYTVFFKYIEPLLTLGPALQTSFQPLSYLDFVPLPYNPGSVRINAATLTTMDHLSQMYLTVTILSIMAFRSSDDLKVWRHLVFCYWAADFRVAYSVGRTMGWDILYNVGRWSSTEWAYLGAIYTVFMIKSGFLLGIGVYPEREEKGQKIKAKRL